MRASHHVPQDEFTRRGQRITFSDKFRGQVVELKGTIISERWERSYGQNFFRVQPDVVEGMESLTRYAMSVRNDRVIKIEEV